jgi:hypothetical protein
LQQHIFELIVLSLYNSKTHGGLDIQLHRLFDEDTGMGDVGFAKGV